MQRTELAASATGVFWLESDPVSGGNVIMTLEAGVGIPLLSRSFSARSQVNGYGGGALCAGPESVFAVEASGQQVYHIDTATGACSPLTDDDACYGGLSWDAVHHRVLAVREANGRQQLMGIALTDSESANCILHESEDFYSAPAVSADGRHLAWVSWSLPDMPWVASVLWTASIQRDGSLTQARRWPSPSKGSVQQPIFDGDDVIVLSDHEGWWQPWRLASSGQWHLLDGTREDHASAPWQLGERHHQCLPDGGWVRVRYQAGVGQLWLCSGNEETGVRIAREYVDFRCLVVQGQRVLCIARSSTRLDTVLSVDWATGHAEPLSGGEEPFPEMTLSQPELFSVPTSVGGGDPISGFFYPPVPSASDGKSVPIILIAHGGPTSTAYPVLNLQTQFWCHQGFAVAEVNYRGSSGFGRAFRMALAGSWGQVDVADMERAARWLVANKAVDPARLFIQGRSSGGYTALLAMVQTDVFAAGASQFGVSDPRRLRAMTHRFESGYLDWLLGSPDDCPDNWQQRSPLAQADRLCRPMIFFQGAQDRVVVPQQTTAIVNALRRNGGSPEVYVYPDEGHGFRKQSNVADMLERLLRFYRRQSTDQ